jgi:hypothetical protein
MASSSCTAASRGSPATARRYTATAIGAQKGDCDWATISFWAVGIADSLQF